MSSMRATLVLTRPARRLVVRVIRRDAPARRDGGSAEVRIVAGRKGPAHAVEVRVAAENPVAALNAQRRGAAAEARALEARDDLVVQHGRPALEIRSFVKHC